MKVWKKVLVGAVSLLLLAGGLMAWRIGPRNLIGLIRYDQRREGSLRVGDLAPDVALVALDGKTPVRLAASVGDRPLVLVLGSFT